ncbi:MAG: hypothetical protein IIZ16_00805 [Selenomonas sp.]|nr:hypothetical protein [Selenomonas sp.]MBQ1460552.1 hypothetical protein [Selenomonas sp.]
MNIVEISFVVKMMGELLHYVPVTLALAVSSLLLANQFLGLIKGTSIVFVISVVEILGAAKVACAESYRYLETYLAAALIYWAFSIVFEYLFAWAERYWGTYRRGRAQLC